MAKRSLAAKLFIASIAAFLLSVPLCASGYEGSDDRTFWAALLGMLLFVSSIVLLVASLLTLPSSRTLGPPSTR